MDRDDTPEVSVAEPATEDTSATVDGAVIGEVDGLLWEDVSGVDIVCVTVGVGHFAVPVDHGQWRGGDDVALGYDETLVRPAPQLGYLQHLAPAQAVEQVADHYAVDLGGPPPGPDPQPLPPWWSAAGSP